MSWLDSTDWEQRLWRGSSQYWWRKAAISLLTDVRKSSRCIIDDEELWQRITPFFHTTSSSMPMMSCLAVSTSDCDSFAMILATILRLIVTELSLILLIIRHEATRPPLSPARSTTTMASREARLASSLAGPSRDNGMMWFRRLAQCWCHVSRGKLTRQRKEICDAPDVMYEKASKMRNKEVKEMKEEVVIRPTLS